MAEIRNPIDYPVMELTTLDRAGKRRVTRFFGRLMLFLLVVTPFILAFAPWQQNLPGIGRVIELDPVNRPMPLQARTEGLIMRWHVREGQLVKAGDPIVDLADNDPDILERLQDQLDAAIAKRDAAVRKRNQLELQVKSAEQAREAAIRLADDEIAAAEQKLVMAKQSVEVAKQKLALAKFAEEMYEGMFADQIGSGFDVQKARQERSVAEADLRAKNAAVAGAEAELRAKKSKKDNVTKAEQVKVQDTKAKQNGAEGDLATAEGSIPKLKRDLERQRQQQIKAPLDGYVQNLVANGQGGGFVKKGTTLATIVPATKQLAVELWINGNDITFIDVGRHVRLQFEGWPAIQWVGWPSAAVGTFGGKVAFIDRADDGTGQFRVMVVPDERPFAENEGPVVDWLRNLLTIEKPKHPESRNYNENPHAWPGDPWLRQGVRTKGWIVLDRVSLGFEVWRQLNGFPPTVKKPEDMKGKSEGGK